MKQALVTKRESEHIAIAEFLLILRETKEKRGRKYSNQELWGALQHCTVEITDLSEDKKSKQWLELTQNEYDLDSSSVSGDILANDSNDSNDYNATEDVDLDTTAFMGEA